MDTKALLESMYAHDYSYGRKQLTQTAQYILRCVQANQLDDARVELSNNGDKVSSQTRAILNTILSIDNYGNPV